MIYRDRTVVADASRYLSLIAMTMNPVAICNPTNLSDIEKDWKTSARAGYFPNPYFRYNDEELHRIALLGNNIFDYWQQIRNNCICQSKLDRVILEILENRACNAMLAAEIAAGIYNEEDLRTQGAITTVYGRPNSFFTMRCYDVLERPTTYYSYNKPRFNVTKLAELESRSFKATEIRDTFNAVLDYYGFRPAWECVLDPMVKTIDARDKTEDGQSRLIVPSRRISNGRSMAILIGHEIESHIRGSENSRALLRKIIGGTPLEPLINLLAKADNEQFYEGVAKMSDVAIVGNDAIPHPFYTIAINLALNEGKSFGEVANTIYMLKYTGTETRDTAINFAWTVTRRIFRGATDTSRGFAFTKDYGYLAGYDIAKNIPTCLHDYSTFTLKELKLLEDAGVDFMSPAYPKKDAIKDVLGA